MSKTPGGHLLALLVTFPRLETVTGCAIARIRRLAVELKLAEVYAGVDFQLAPD